MGAGGSTTLLSYAVRLCATHPRTHARTHVHAPLAHWPEMCALPLLQNVSNFLWAFAKLEMQDHTLFQEGE